MSFDDWQKLALIGLSPTFAASKLTYEPLPQDDPKQRLCLPKTSSAGFAVEKRIGS
jgi:hypothetical protein